MFLSELLFAASLFFRDSGALQHKERDNIPMTEDL